MVMKNSPLVSVCCITYNHQDYIEDCIKGFLKQEIPYEVEFLIHDDASTDQTQSLIKSLVGNDPRFKLILREKNIKSTGTAIFPILYKEAKGKYIALCEGDDYWTDSYKLQKQVDYMESHPECVLTYHAWIEMRDEKLQKFKKSKKLDSSTHTIMFRNIIDKFQDHLYIPVLNGDTLLKFLLSHYGKECFVDGIEPAVKRRDSGGVWNSLSFQEKQKSNLLTAELSLKELRGTKFENRAKIKFVNALISSNRHLRAKKIEHLSLTKEISLVLKYGVFFKYSWSKLAYLKSDLINVN
jgi:glycosyltransferase involved in cell wall biosynthesis